MRISSNPIQLPEGLKCEVNGNVISFDNGKLQMQLPVHGDVAFSLDEGVLTFAPQPNQPAGKAMAGTMRTLANNMVIGLTSGFEKKLELHGVGYRAALSGNALDLTLGLSHPVRYPVPEGINIAVPSQTEIVISGHDKQQVGQVAAEIRAFRKPEPYKGKGIRYADEVIVLREVKKKS